ncbi:hypothetical protein ACQ4PT_045150 [Festuca glaucescens]
MDGLLDELLPVIVSFLPAHDAVRTCVLAKRWRHVWTSAPALRITAVKGFRSADQFNRFVDRLLLQRRQGLCPLESCEFNMVESDFEFDWSLCVEHVYLYSLHSALQCNLQSLSCHFMPTDPTDFAEDLQEPAAPFLSNHIQRLQLSFIRSSLDFSGCPRLLDLQMHECVILADSIVSNSLQYLSMSCCQLYMRHRTSISLPHLVRLDFTDCFGKMPLFESLPSLEKALVRIGEFTGDECDGSGSACCLNENPCWECRFAFEFDADRGRSYLFQGLSRASHLELSASYDHAFIFQRDLKWRPKFPMLKTLVLDDWCLDADLSAVILFIQQSPNLEKLTLELFEEFDSSMVSEGSNHLLPGASVPDHLKMVEIKCEIVDVRVNKVLKILNTYSVSLDRIYIRQTDTNPGCSAFVCTGFNLN